MKTIADKNRIETELRCTPSNIFGKQGEQNQTRLGFAAARKCRIYSNIGGKRERSGKGRRTAKRVALGAVVIVAVWFVAGLAKTAIADPNVRLSHLLIAIIVLRWFFVRGASALKAIILIIIITAIFN